MCSPKPKEASISKGTKDTATTSSGVKRKRGRTSMDRIEYHKITGRKLVVEYNPKGAPFGKVAAELASYIGVLARTTVPIIVESWPKVEKDLKNNIWDSVKMAFVLAPGSRKMVLSSAANKWRQFKSDLTRKYVMPFKDQPEALKNPPEEYDFIDQQHWQQFVNGRLSKEFQKLHKEQKERRAKLQYAHRMSRKGYAGLEAELKKKMPEDKLDRSLLWKKGREGKKGNISHETIGEQAAKIDLLMEQKKERVISTSTSNDVLTMEMGGTPNLSEHSPDSATEGVGGFVEPNVSRPQLLEGEAVLDVVRKMIEQERTWFQAKITELETRINGNCPTTPIPLPTPVSNPSEKANCSGKKRIVAENNEIDLEELAVVGKRDAMKGKPCTLVLGSMDNMVALGTIIEVDVANHTVHGVPLGEGNMRVAIDVALDEAAVLPIPVAGELVTVGQAIGSHVAWPKGLVLTDDEERGKTAVKPRDSPKQDVSLPKSLKPLYRYAERAMMDGETISVHMEEAVFGVAKTVHISQEDVMHFMEMKEISAMCITVYMRHLYDMLKQANIVNLVGLTDPSSISIGVGNCDRNSQVLAARIQQTSADQILLVPYNFGYHWMLTIISEDKDVCYFMDPLRRYFMDSLRRSMREEEWKFVVNNAIRQFNAQMGRGVRKPPVWKVLTGPKQPSNMECGYYVMRYMKEIVEDKNLSFVTKWKGKELNAYTQTELDEVRCEWTDFVIDYM